MDEPHDSDATLMAQVVSANRDAFDTLVRRHADGLLTFLHRMTGDRHRAEELFQEVFLAVWTQRRAYRPGSPLRPWLYGIAMNRCRADFRKARPAPVDFQADPPAPQAVAGDPSPPQTAIDAETAAIVSDCVARLPARQRAVLVLRIWNEMSYYAIANTLRCGEGTARSHMYHALETLRKRLEPHMR